MATAPTVTRRPVLAALLAAALYLAGYATGRAATPPPALAPLPSLAPVVVPELTGQPLDSAPVPTTAPADVLPVGSPTPAPVAPIESASATASPVVAPERGISGRTRSVSLTWYCNGDAGRARLSRCTRGYPDRAGTADLFAAASPDLRYLRGLQVSVCAASGRCVSVRVVDCNCRAVAALDLYADAFAQLAALSRGRLTGARVTW
jgi:hypothetical protein